MKKIVLLISLVLVWAGQVWAVPVLQVGVPDGDGGYVDYTTSGDDSNTAFTSGNTFSVAGLYANGVVNLGGQYGSGSDWTNFGLPSYFAGKRAVLIATVSEGVSGTLQVKVGNTGSFLDPFYKALVDENDYFVDNHFPLNKEKIYDFFYFDIGDFAQLGTVPNFAAPTDVGSSGEVKILTLNITGFDWVHFDVMALETYSNDTKKVGNPGSHDVTWKYDGTVVSTGDPVPEPGTIILVGVGLVGVAVYRRRQGK
ncbi:MAG: hypothetical protein A2X84_14225 [Desulfuromonadaceae bacterium GWC2_58_13]|nr:MAG: hypothetical protein A2X84_14225 [Desulfuromonadaceae bacterium GWC2_58_13]